MTYSTEVKFATRPWLNYKRKHQKFPPRSTSSPMCNYQAMFRFFRIRQMGSVTEARPLSIALSLVSLVSSLTENALTSEKQHERLALAPISFICHC